MSTTSGSSSRCAGATLATIPASRPRGRPKRVFESSSETACQANEVPSFAWVKYTDRIVDCVKVSEIKDFKPVDCSDFDSEKLYKVYWPSSISNLRDNKTEQLQGEGYFDAFIKSLGGSEILHRPCKDVKRFRSKPENQSLAKVTESEIKASTSKRKEERKLQKDAAASKSLDIISSEASNYKKKFHSLEKKYDTLLKKNTDLELEIKTLKELNYKYQNHFFTVSHKESNLTDISRNVPFVEPLTQFRSLLSIEDSCIESPAPLLNNNSYIPSQPRQTEYSTATITSETTSALRATPVSGGSESYLFDIGNCLGKSLTALSPEITNNYSSCSENSTVDCGNNQSPPSNSSRHCIETETTQSVEPREIEKQQAGKSVKEKSAISSYTIDEEKIAACETGGTISAVCKKLTSCVWLPDELAERCATGIKSNAHLDHQKKKALTPVKVQAVHNALKAVMVRRGYSADAINIQKKNFNHWMTEKCTYARQVKERMEKKEKHNKNMD